MLDKQSNPHHHLHVRLLLLSIKDSFLLRDPSPSPLNELSHSASWWADREEHREQGDSLRVGQNEVNEMDECF